jgi:hypothetical protein
MGGTESSSNKVLHLVALKRVEPKKGKQKMGFVNDILNAASLGVYGRDEAPKPSESANGELEPQSGVKTWLPPRQSDLEALRREVNALRERVKDTDEGVEARRREVNALRVKAEKAEGVVEELRRQVEEVLRVKLEEVEVALRERKAEEAEIVKRAVAGLEEEKAEIVERTAARLVERMAGPAATSQRSSDAQTPSRDDVPIDPYWQRSQGWPAPHPGEQHPPGTWVDGHPRTDWERYQQEQMDQRIRGHEGGD